MYRLLASQLDPTPGKRGEWAKKSANLTKYNSEIRSQSKLKNREIELINKMINEEGSLKD